MLNGVIPVDNDVTDSNSVVFLNPLIVILGNVFSDIYMEWLMDDVLVNVTLSVPHVMSLPNYLTSRYL